SSQKKKAQRLAHAVHALSHAHFQPTDTAREFPATCATAVASRAHRHLLVSQLTIQFPSATLSELVFCRGETRAGDTWEGRKEQPLRAILVMGSQARRRRPTRPSPNTCPFLTRALGVACLAGATTLSAAFV
ncbi:unnamed protein product, partial [Ectocarpus sp. 12 AP-2014]